MRSMTGIRVVVDVQNVIIDTNMEDCSKHSKIIKVQREKVKSWSTVPSKTYR